MPVTSAPRAALYARQSVDEEQGIAQQLDDGRAEAARRGWPVVAEFSDNDTSGSKERGEGTDWDAMLKAFDDDAFDVLIVTETSRLTRSLTDVLDVRPPRRDVRIVVITQNIDTDVDDFQLKLLVLVAEDEVKRKTRRAARYAAERRKAGHPTPGLPPHGYRWVPSAERDALGTRYVVVPDEADDVRRIFAEFLAGAPLGQIARDLNASGRRTRSGARWLSSTVRRLLMNPLLAALLPPSQPTGKHDLAAIDLDACTPGAWEPIVDRDQLVAARARLVGVAPNHSGTARRWLLSGLAVCAVCRKPVRSARGETHPTARRDGTGTAPAQRYHTYRCSGVPCHFQRNGDAIDELVAEVCIERLSRADVLTLFPRPEGEDLAALHARREALRASRRNVFALVGEDPALLADAQDRLDELGAQLREVDARVAAAVSRSPLADLVDAPDVRGWWNAATLARRRAVVELLLDVAIKPVGPGRRPSTPAALLETLEITPKKARRGTLGS